MISKIEQEALLNNEPTFENSFCSIQALPGMPKGMLKETKQAVALARKFKEEVVKPMALELDRKTHENSDYLPWDLIQKANEWGFYTMFIPKIFGGRGINMPAASYVIEEISSACVGIANVIFVHYLGVAGILASGNIALANRIFREVVEGERTGKPCLISLAITEPGAGTDVEENELVDRARLNCYARKVDGGYIVNGSKIFISMGHVSTWCCLIAYSDQKKPSENTISFAVKTGTKGFSFGKHEDKMGQRVCPASELIFEDCFIPDEFVLSDSKNLSSDKRTVKEIIEQYIHYVVEVTRPAVGAFGTGVARGAYEIALKFAGETEVDGKLLINHEWAQSMLAEMYKNVVIGRLSYVEANYANSLPGGIYSLLQQRFIYYFVKYMPESILNLLVTPFLKTKLSSKIFRKVLVESQSIDEQHRASGWASLAKIVGTDMGVKNSQMALEMMGYAGLRHENGAEKFLRDSKLLQIYEGTNQLNRINLFATHIGSSLKQVRIFEE
ncbi:MAG: acyl-CoA dehydrogenase family protein [bacterium]